MTDTTTTDRVRAALAGFNHEELAEAHRLTRPVLPVATPPAGPRFPATGNRTPAEFAALQGRTGPLCGHDTCQVAFCTYPAPAPAGRDWRGELAAAYAAIGRQVGAEPALDCDPDELADQEMWAMDEAADRETAQWETDYLNGEDSTAPDDDPDGLEAHARSLGFTPEEYDALAAADLFPGDVSDRIRTEGWPGDEAAAVLLRFRDPDGEPDSDSAYDPDAPLSRQDLADIISDYAIEAQVAGYDDLADRLVELAERV